MINESDDTLTQFNYFFTYYRDTSHIFPFVNCFQVSMFLILNLFFSSRPTPTSRTFMSIPNKCTPYLSTHLFVQPLTTREAGHRQIITVISPDKSDDGFNNIEPAGDDNALLIT